MLEFSSTVLSVPSPYHFEVLLAGDLAQCITMQATTSHLKQLLTDKLRIRQVEVIHDVSEFCLGLGEAYVQLLFFTDCRHHLTYVNQQPHVVNTQITASYGMARKTLPLTAVSHK